MIFERVGCGRSGAKPRRSPRKRNTAAIAKSTKLAQGKSRVIGNRTKIKKKLMKAATVSSKPTQSGQLIRRNVIVLILGYR
jgi:hypothetical protein